MRTRESFRTVVSKLAFFALVFTYTSTANADMGGMDAADITSPSQYATYLSPNTSGYGTIASYKGNGYYDWIDHFKIPVTRYQFTRVTLHFYQTSASVTL